MSDCDVVVLGGGPGGYAAALYGASAGLRVTLVEAEGLGGTCLNRGCIPAKALLQTAEVLRTSRHATDFGIVSSPRAVLTADWSAVAARTSGIVDTLVGGLGGLLKRRKVEVVRGRGRLTADGAVEVDGQVLRGRAVVLATGSVPRSIHGFDVDGEQIVTSDHTTRASSVPERVAVIGGGVIGVEFASVFTDVGSTVALLEAEPGGVLPVGPDPELSQVLDAALRRRGTRIVGGARVSQPERSRDGIVLGFESPAGSDKIEVDQVLVAVGRRPATDDLGLADAGVRVDGRGFVEVDTATMATSRPGVYAVGDVVATPGLAHVGYGEAVVAIQAILGERPVPVDYSRVPWVVYTHPEVAWVGLTEADATAAGHDVVVHRHKFAGNGRAMIIGETDGLVKVVAQRDGPVLGVHIVGPWASELITESQLAVNWEALPSEVAAFVHAHPSLSEAVGETMFALTGRSLHG